MEGLEMEKSQAKTKRQGMGFWIICFALVLPGLFYYGYCLGLWGRNSLLLQYLFQCNCPSSTEGKRYPEGVEVIVSACHNGGVRLSPSGRFLAVRDNEDEHSSTYLLDFQTHQKIDFTLPYSS